MAWATFDEVSASRRLRKAGFRLEQAEAVVQTVIQANALTIQMVQDLAELKAYIRENMVTKSDLAETLGRYDLQNMVTKSDIKSEFAKLYRNLFFAGMAFASITVASTATIAAIAFL